MFITWKEFRFSAPKGGERACPEFQDQDFSAMMGFSAPKGVERACPSSVPFVAPSPTLFQCPEGR